MLAKVSELNKNAVILLSVAMIAITSIVITLLIISGTSGGKTNIDSITDFQKAFIKEYGVTPDIDISIYRVSEAQAETITKQLAGELNLKEVILEEYEGTEWYETEDEEGSIRISAHFE
jgi:F0F1-type ATP synthase alpha subunit